MAEVTIQPSPRAAERLKAHRANQTSNSSSQPQQLSPNSPLLQNSSFDPKADQPSLSDLGNRPPEYKPGKLEKKYNEFFTYQFGPCVILILWWITQDLDKAQFYAPTPEECSGIAPHAARIVSRFSAWAKVPSEIHEIITSSDDAVALCYVLTGYMSRIGLFERLGPVLMGMFMKGNTVAKPDKPPTGSPGKIPTPIYSAPNPEPSTNGHFPVNSIPGLGGQWQS